MSNMRISPDAVNIVAVTTGEMAIVDSQKMSRDSLTTPKAMKSGIMSQDSMEGSQDQRLVPRNTGSGEGKTQVFQIQISKQPDCQEWKPQQQLPNLISFGTAQDPNAMCFQSQQTPRLGTSDRINKNRRVLISQVQRSYQTSPEPLHNLMGNPRAPPATAQFFQRKERDGSQNKLKANADISWTRFLASDSVLKKKRRGDSFDYRKSQHISNRSTNLSQTSPSTDTGLFAKISTQFQQAQLTKTEKFKQHQRDLQKKPQRKSVVIRRAGPKPYVIDQKQSNLMTSLSSQHLSSEKPKAERFRASMDSEVTDLNNYLNSTGVIPRTSQNRYHFKRLQWQQTTSTQQVAHSQNNISPVNKHYDQSTLLKESDFGMDEPLPRQSNDFGSSSLLGCKLERRNKSKGKQSGKESGITHTPGSSILDEYMDYRYDQQRRSNTPSVNNNPRKSPQQPIHSMASEEKIGSTINMDKVTIDQEVLPVPVTAVNINDQTRQSSVFLQNADIELTNQMTAAAQYFQQEAVWKGKTKGGNGASEALMQKRVQLQKRARSQAQMKRLQTEMRLENFMPTPKRLQDSVLQQYLGREGYARGTPDIPRPTDYILSSKSSSVMKKTANHYRVKRGPAKLIKSDYKHNGVRIF